MSCEKIVLTSGLPGSGKSTWSKDQVQHGACIINKDAIRVMIHGGNYVYDTAKEPVVKEMSLRCLQAAVDMGIKYVILDETFINRKSRESAVNFIREKFPTIEIHATVFTESENNLEYRMRDPRNVKREVWASVIESMKLSHNYPEINEGFDRVCSIPEDLSTAKTVVEL